MMEDEVLSATVAQQPTGSGAALPDASREARDGGAPTKPRVHSLSACVVCEAQGDDFPSANVEAFELDGELVCDDCADGYIEQWHETNGQFGVGA